MISDYDLLVTRYISVPKTYSSSQLHPGAVVAGIVRGMLDAAGFPARWVAAGWGGPSAPRRRPWVWYPGRGSAWRLRCNGRARRKGRAGVERGAGGRTHVSLAPLSAVQRHVRQPDPTMPQYTRARAATPLP